MTSIGISLRLCAISLLCVAIAGCADRNAPPKIEVQTIKVEVPVKREMPKALADCAYTGPAPKWLPVEGKPDWAALDPDGQRFARDMIVTIMGCNAALKSWGKAP